MDGAPKSMFPSGYDVATPPGAEGWKDIYPYYTQFQNSRRAEDDGKFWFCNSQHWPTPFKPFDTIMLDFAIKGLGQYNTRHLLVPPANGIECRSSLTAPVTTS
jgi:pyruvate, water dikinase